MLQLRLRQIEIKRERDEKCKELSKVTGATVICLPIKNYFKYPKDTQVPNETQPKNKFVKKHHSSININIRTKSRTQSLKNKNHNRRYKSSMNVRNHPQRDDDDYKNRRTEDYYYDDSSDDSNEQYKKTQNKCNINKV